MEHVPAETLMIRPGSCKLKSYRKKSQELPLNYYF